MSHKRIRPLIGTALALAVSLGGVVATGAGSTATAATATTPQTSAAKPTGGKPPIALAKLSAALTATSVADVPDTGVPTAVDLTTDLGSKPGSVANYGDSIYINGTVHSGGHDFGLLVQLLRRPTANIDVINLSVVDEKTGWYRQTQNVLPAPGAQWSINKLDIAAPGLTWTGDAKHQHIVASTSWGSLDIRTDAQGTAMYYGGTGSFDLLGDPQIEFALPQMHTTGRLTLGAQNYPVTGSVWLDRQWGPVDFSKAEMTTTWMNISLSNGDKIAIWNPRDATTQQSWATILHPDGTQELVPVTPLDLGVSQRWISPVTGSGYPTKWHISIPTRHTELTVQVTSPDQEIVGAGGSLYEGAAHVTGVYHGHHITGSTYVEQVGDWKV